MPFASRPRSSRYYSFQDVTELTGLSRSTLMRWESAKRFPRRVVLGPKNTAWVRTEVEAWMTEREQHHRKRV